MDNQTTDPMELLHQLREQERQLVEKLLNNTVTVDDFEPDVVDKLVNLLQFK